MQITTDNNRLLVLSYGHINMHCVYIYMQYIETLNLRKNVRNHTCMPNIYTYPIVYIVYEFDGVDITTKTS